MVTPDPNKFHFHVMQWKCACGFTVEDADPQYAFPLQGHFREVMALRNMTLKKRATPKEETCD